MTEKERDIRLAKIDKNVSKKWFKLYGLSYGDWLISSYEERDILYSYHVLNRNFKNVSYEEYEKMTKKTKANL